jgi:prepilin-type N-terminal cleavage/methylation domain-containing protein
MPSVKSSLIGFWQRVIRAHLTASLSSDKHYCKAAFTLVEMLIVIGIISLLLVIAIPSFSGMQRAGDITKSAYEVAGALELARAFALAHNTYVWVGFFEEDGSIPSTNPATAGIGRVVLSVVASKDGTTIYDSAQPGDIDPTKLSQVMNLVKLVDIRLKTFPDGSNTNTTFDGRPAAGSNDTCIGDSTPAAPSSFPFQFPLGEGATPALYTFTKTIKFNPSGESRVNSTYSMQPVVEIGLQPSPGNQDEPSNPNVVTIQIGGIGGNVNIYRK